MEIINEKDGERTKKALEGNIFSKLEFEVREKIEENYRKFAIKLSTDLDKHVKKEFSEQGITFKYVNSMELGANANRGNNSEIGEVKLKIGTFVKLYEFYNEIDEVPGIYNLNNKDAISEIMVEFIINFIIAHEIAHLYFGHLSLYEQFKKDKCNMDIQTLEMDADIFAVNILIQWINKDAYFKSVDGEIWSILIAALHSLFYLERNRSELITIEEKEHPPMIIRESIVLAVIEKCTDVDINTIIKGIEAKYNSVYEVSNVEQDSFIEMYNKLVNYGDVLLENMEKHIRVKLDGISYLPLKGIDY